MVRGENLTKYMRQTKTDIKTTEKFNVKDSSLIITSTFLKI